jgi:queuosine precursor transporter
MVQYRFLNLIILWNVVLALICIPTAGKLVDIFGTPLSVTIFYFPFLYVFSDVTTEVYGYAVARRVLWYTIAAQVFATAVFQFSIALPSSVVMRNNQAFVDVLSTAPRLVFFGNIAVFAGDTVNNYVVAKMKVWSHGRRLPLRFVASTFLGQAVNTTIFYVFALGTIPAGVLAKTILVETLISVAIAVVFLPGSLAVSSWLKRTEEVDFFDTDTDFNPLKF